MTRFSRVYFTAFEVLWAVALIGLPLTTFPAFSSLTGAIVAPFSGAPMLLMLVLWLLPALILRRRQLPVETWPVYLYVLVALLSSAAAFFIEIPTFKGATVPRQELRAFSTLAIGLAFYLVSASWAQDPSGLRKSLRWIHIGGALMIAYSFSQVWYILSGAQSYPEWFLDLQGYLAVKPDYFFFRGNRTSGLAYEASWFGHQMTTLYIPLWLSATVLRKSSFNLRVLGLSVENVLLVLGLFVFLMSGPRIALLSLLLMLVVLLVLFNVWLVRRITGALASRWQGASPRRLRFGLPAGITLALITGYLIVMAGGIFLMSQRDARLQLLLSEPPTWEEIRYLATLDEPTLIAVGARLAFMERVVYWLTGWHTFAEYPWLGVGLGNSGFFFLQNLPGTGWMSQEIRNVVGVLTSLPNIKALWVRLLAETGLLGFYVFAGWYFLTGKSAQLLRRSQEATFQILGLAGVLALAAFLSEGFSIDSFAMPYLWVITGLVAAAGFSLRKEAARGGPSPAGD